jgi:hypothetical protein
MTQEINGEDIPIIHPNVGEPAKFTTTIHTHGAPLTDVPVKVDIKKGTNNINAPSISGWPQTKQVASTSEDEEAVTDWEWTPTEEGDYYVFIETGDLSQDYVIGNNKDSFKVYVRNPNARVLVVDDDNSANSNGVFYLDTEWKMLDALDDLGISYNVFNVEWNKTGPTKAIMDKYEAVIWMTGLDNEYDNYGKNPSDSWSTTGEKWGITLKPEDISELKSFLNEGSKNIWIISPGYLYDNINNKGGGTPTGFLKEYLHIDYVVSNQTVYDSNGDTFVRGTPNPLSGVDLSLGRGAEYATYETEPEEGFSDRGGAIAVKPPARPVFYQNDAHTAYNAAEISGDYNAVYFAFNFYLLEIPADRSDLVYRVMNFFGLEGGLEVKLEDTETKEVDFGETVSFKFKASNLGRMTETLNLKLASPAPENIPNGWNVKINDKAASATLNEITVPGGATGKIFYVNVTAPSTFMDSSGNKDPTIKNTTYGSNEKPIQLKVRAESKIYPDKFFGLAGCFVKIGLPGYVELTAPVTSKMIDIADELEGTTEFYVDYDIQLKNITNGKDNYNVKVEVDNPDAVVLMGTTEITTDDIVGLAPLQRQDLTVRVYADEYDPMGDYFTTFTVMDTYGVTLNNTVLTTTVEQYYNIAISPLAGETYEMVLDPNTMKDYTETFSFEVYLENYGNGPDTIELEWDENYDSPNAIPINWEDSLVEIYDKEDMSDTIDSISVPAYDKDSDEPGMVTLIVQITVPKEEEEGEFWIDLQATSSAPSGYINKLMRDDFLYEDIFTFKVEMVLPELSFDSNKCKFLKEDGTDYRTGDELYEGDSITVVTVLENTGSSIAEDVTVECKFNILGETIKMPSENITIPKGKSVYLNWSVVFDRAGVHQFEVKIDPSKDIIGDYNGDNTWKQYIEVMEKPAPPINGPPDVFESSSNLALIVVIIAVVIILIIVLLFFFIRLKKSKDDELDDIDSDMMTEGMGMGGPQFPGMMQPPGQQARMQTSREQMAALAPKSQRQLPPSGGDAPDGIKICGSCSEKNPSENKFCQTCGGKL